MDAANTNEVFLYPALHDESNPDADVVTQTKQRSLAYKAMAEFSVARLSRYLIPRF
jgi:hypothetical protein